MKLLHIDAFSGAAGDMFLGALLDLGVDLQALRAGIATLHLDGWRLEAGPVRRAGLAAVKARVLCDALGGAEERALDHHQHHRSVVHDHDHGRTPREIIALITNSGLPDPAKTLAARAFALLAEAEAKVHGTTADEVRFHEVGAVDAIVDICGTALGIHLLGVAKVHAGPVATGTGTMHTSHGELPVPGPATLELLAGIPVRPTTIPRELLTPTGAAILRALDPDFGPPPLHRVLRAGYGAGSDDRPELPNVLRLVLLEALASGSGASDTVVEITFEVDDMTPEALGHFRSRLPREDVLDLSVTACLMKKDRPAHRVTILAPEGALERLEPLIFQHSTTFGFRMGRQERRVLDREIVTLDTPLGACRVKLGRWRGGLVRFHPEPDDVAALALEHGLSFSAVEQQVREAGRARFG